MKQPSQNDRVLAVLLRKGGATTAEIHQEVGPCRLNSRVAELRKKGWSIRCDHLAGSGPGAYLYVLEDSAPGEHSRQVPAGTPVTRTTDELGLVGAGAETHPDQPELLGAA